MNQESSFKNLDFLKWLIAGLVFFIIILVAFGAGIKVGTIKARYSYQWAENYHRNFAKPRNGFWQGWQNFPAGDFIGGHGTFGEIIEIKNNSFVIKDQENIEKVIITKENTIIVKGRKKIKNGLKIGDQIMVIGSPNEDGQIEAKFIRLFPDDQQRRRFYPNL